MTKTEKEVLRIFAPIAGMGDDAGRIGEYLGFQVRLLVEKIDALNATVAGQKDLVQLLSERSAEMAKALDEKRRKLGVAVEALVRIENGTPGPPLTSEYASEIGLATWTASQGQITACKAPEELRK